MAKAIRGDKGHDPRPLMHLAQYDLDLSQITLLSKLVEERRDDLAAAGLGRVRVALAATHTINTVAECIPGTGLRHRLLVDTFRAEYGTIAQMAFNTRSALHEFDPDFVWLSLDPAALGLDAHLLDGEASDAAVQSALDHVKSLRDAVRTNGRASVIVHTLPVPSTPLFGSFDARHKGSVRSMVQRFNMRLISEVLLPDDLLLDLAMLAERVGLDAWHDRQRWHLAKLPFALDCAPLVADHLSRLLAAARGLSRKCLVLDLDNTIWGGVIGDDGVENITLGQGSADGEAFLEIQSLARDLRNRGVILAVCSKNEEDIARLAFRMHEEMILKEDDIAVFAANWTDKASNLRHIAQTLNIGTDALVFLDDNPAEREQVRQELPEVAVPEIGPEPALYATLLANAGYFEATSFGDEDIQRAAMYKANSLRASQMQTSGNMDEYLRSLGMVCAIRPFDPIGRARTAQLINKSNQFNLTNRRYTEAEVAAMEVDPARFTMQVRLIDRFGDNGMISVAVFDKADAEWRCDTWLMSCRVIGRRVEEAMLAHVAAAARAAGAERLIGDYLPTARNVMVKDHYKRLGFLLIEDLPGGGTRWALEIAGYEQPELPMKIENAQTMLVSQSIAVKRP